MKPSVARPKPGYLERRLVSRKMTLTREQASFAHWPWRARRPSEPRSPSESPFRGDLYRAHDTNLKATLRRSIAQVKGKYIRELCLPSRQLTLAGLTLYRLLLPRGKQSREPPKTNRSKGQAHPPCDMPRSERCRIRGNCLQGIALPSPAQAPAAGRAPGAGRAAPASGSQRAVKRA